MVSIYIAGYIVKDNLDGVAALCSCLALHCRFYTESLGMKVLRMRDIPDEKYTNALLGYGPEETNFVLELTYSE